jgi:hypothetical protein
MPGVRRRPALKPGEDLLGRRPVAPPIPDDQIPEPEENDAADSEPS